MEIVNGEFIMMGCDPSDPSVLRSPADAISLINTIGFLPLFSNAIPSFSIEEHVPASVWFTGDPTTDPWEWRMILAADPSIAYGKFFNKTAGFISKSFFPTFANYRRDGYDFDALFEDELASYRAKKIMDVFECNDESVGKSLISSEIRELAGKDEAALTELQMQTYLIISSFRQKKNKAGQSYGWHLAVMETPETKWGHAHITSEYSTDPVESWKKIIERVTEHFPEAGEAEVRKILGIRYPGEDRKSKASTSAVNKKAAEKRVRSYDLPWPENLLRAMEESAVKAAEKKARREAEDAEYAGTAKNPDVPAPPLTLPEHLTKDQMDGLEHALSTLKENERKAIALRYKQSKTIKETAESFSLTGSRIQQIIAKALRKLRHPSRLNYIREGLQGLQVAEERKKAEVRKAMESGDRGRIFEAISLYDLKLSVRSTNCLVRSGMRTLSDLVKTVEEKPASLRQIRNLRRQSLQEVLEKLEEYGVECYEVRRACEFGTERREDIAEMEPSVRLYNILIRAGLDTVSKIEERIRENARSIIQLDGMGRKTIGELIEKMENMNVDCGQLKEELKWLGWI